MFENDTVDPLSELGVGEALLICLDPSRRHRDAADRGSLPLGIGTLADVGAALA